MESGRLMFSSAAPCRAGGGQMMLFGGSGSFLGGVPAVSGVEDGRRRKRPFLTTALDEDLQMEYDDEMYGYGGLDSDERAPGTGRTKRRLTAEQVRALERSFEEEKRKLEPERKSELARRLGMAPRQVAVWFQNRRARWKAKQLERDFDALRAAHDDLLAGRDALLADNDSLRLQVISLTEELRTKASSPVSEPEEHTTALGMVHAGASAPPALAAQPKEACDACAANTNAGAGAAGAPAIGITGGSPESYSCFADARSPPPSSDDDCGGAANSEGGCAFFLPDGAMLEGAVAAVERESEAEAAAQLNYWAWFWN